MVKTVNAYLADRTRRNELSPESVASIRYTLHHFAAFAGNNPKRWTAEQAEAWIHADGLRASTRKSRRGRLRPFTQWLRRQGIIRRDIAEDIAPIRVTRGSPRNLSRGAVSDLLAVCPDQRAVLIVILMLQLTLRCGDVAHIRIEDIDVHRKRLHVRAKGGRGEPTHWIPITLEAWAHLRPWLTRRAVSAGPLIESYQRPGQPIQGAHVSKLVQRWVRDAGLKMFPHDGVSAHALRHTAAQDMIDSGADVRVVQHGMGHATIRSTEWYLRCEPPGLREAMEGRDYGSAAA